MVNHPTTVWTNGKETTNDMKNNLNIWGNSHIRKKVDIKTIKTSLPAL
jgi:hypothetical protein